MICGEELFVEMRSQGAAGGWPCRFIGHPILYVYAELTESEKKEFMRAIIERIELYPEKRPDFPFIGIDLGVQVVTSD